MRVPKRNLLDAPQARDGGGRATADFNAVPENSVLAVPPTFHAPIREHRARRPSGQREMRDAGEPWDRHGSGSIDVGSISELA